MALSRPGQAILLWLMAAKPKWVQTITTADTISQGSQPCHNATSGTPSAWLSASKASREMANSGSGAGFHTSRNTSVAPSEPSEASTSVSA